ncbi:MAG: hypothetical protein P8X70_02540 [Nanoarchaeota archaeon]
MNKRVLTGILLVFVLTSLLINTNLISAQGEFKENVESVGKEVWGGLEPVIKFVFNLEGKVTGAKATQTLISYIFAFIIVFVFLLLASKDIPLFEDYPGISKFVIVVASILGIRGIAEIDSNLINNIFMPYSVAALAIINGAILIGWFVIVNIGMKDPKFKFMRRFMWILFGVIFVGAWYIRSGQEGGLPNLIQWTYWTTIILATIMALLDGSIQGFFAKMKAEKLANTRKTEIIAQLNKERREYENLYYDGNINEEQFKELMENLNKKAKGLLGIKSTKTYKFDMKNLRKRIGS